MATHLYKILGFNVMDVSNDYTHLESYRWFTIVGCAVGLDVTNVIIEMRKIDPVFESISLNESNNYFMYKYEVIKTLQKILKIFGYKRKVINDGTVVGCWLHDHMGKGKYVIYGREGMVYMDIYGTLTLMKSLKDKDLKKAGKNSKNMLDQILGSGAIWVYYIE